MSCITQQTNTCVRPNKSIRVFVYNIINSRVGITQNTQVYSKELLNTDWTASCSIQYTALVNTVYPWIYGEKGWEGNKPSTSSLSMINHSCSNKHVGTYQFQTKSRYPGIQVSRYQGIQVSRYQGIQVSRHQGFQVSRYQGIQKSRSLGIRVSRYPEIPVPKNPDIQVLRYPGFKVYRYLSIQVSRYPGFQVSRYQVSKESRYPGIKVSNSRYIY